MSLTGNFVSANAEAFRFEGRIDARDPAKPVLIWQGTTVAVGFESSALTLHFGAGVGVCFFNLEVDGELSVIEVKAGAAPQSIQYSKPLAAGPHQLVLFKRSEADVGHVVFRGIELAVGGKVHAPKSVAPKLTVQFFGDSITVGACNEDGVVDQWENHSTHNNALSYAALTAKALGARYRNVAVSGMGVVIGYVPKRAGEIWNRLYPAGDAPGADDAGWSPDVVFVNYGENDDSFAKNQGIAFPSNFTADYVALVKAMRAAYPKVEIVLLLGGMFGGAKSEPLRQAWTSAVQELEAADPRVHHLVFQHWSELHPRVSDHRAMSDELVAWMRASGL